MLHGNSWRKKIFEMSQNDDSKHQRDPDVKENTKDINHVKYSTTVTEVHSGLVESQKVSPLPDNSPDAGNKGSVNGVPQENNEQSGTSIKDKFLMLKGCESSLGKKVCVAID